MAYGKRKGKKGGSSKKSCSSGYKRKNGKCIKK